MSYMLSKILGEALFSFNSTCTFILRPHNIYGPRMGMKHVIPQLLQKVYYENSSELDLYSPKHTRAFCYIDDAINFIERLLKLKENRKTEILNIGNSEEEISMEKLAKIILKVTNKKLKINKLFNTEGSPKRRCPKIKKVMDLTNYKPKYDIFSGLKKTFEWYKKNEFKN